MNSLRVGACLLILASALAACSGGQGDVNGDRQVNRSPQVSSTAVGTALPNSAPALRVDCSAGSVVPSPGGGTNLQGVVTSFFGWRPESWATANLDAVPTVNLWDRKFYQLKSPLSVFGAASAWTEISLVSPASARLYYTDWAAWEKFGQSDPSATIAKSASSTVFVPQCGLEGWTVPGVLLLEGPTCVTFRVTGQAPGAQETITVPFGQERC